MSYCDDCILADICGCESCYDESLTFWLLSFSTGREGCRPDSFAMLLFELSVILLFSALTDAIKQNKDKIIKINMKYLFLNKI